MKFLETISGLFDRKSAGTEILPIQSIPQNKLAISSPYDFTDDAQLRALAQDRRDGITSWVLAGDMVEFFAKLDAYNEGREDAQKINLKLTRSMSERLGEWREKGLHRISDLPQTSGPLVLEGELFLRYMGPQAIGENDMAFECHGQVARAYYHADPLNTNISIQALTGRWSKFEFGMQNGFLDDCFLPASYSLRKPQPHLG